MDRAADTNDVATPFDAVCEPPLSAIEMIPVDTLVPADSPRIAGENIDHVRVLAEITEGLPPIVVHRATMSVIDGMHRVRAAISRRETEIAVRYFDGSTEDAFTLAVQLNMKHGLPLSLADRSAAAARIIRAHPRWSDRRVAAATGLTHKSVAVIRHRTGGGVPQPDDRVGRDGKRRPLNSAEGRLRACRHIAENPDATLREIAEVAGIAVGTARDVRWRLRQGEDPLPTAQRAKHVPAPRAPGLPDAEAAVRSANAERWSRQLREDPSLRYSEAGRMLLRLLEAHRLALGRWNWLLTGVPAHCREAVAHAARGCGESWLRFAQQVDRNE